VKENTISSQEEWCHWY